MLIAWRWLYIIFPSLAHGLVSAEMQTCKMTNLFFNLNLDTFRHPVHPWFVSFPYVTTDVLPPVPGQGDKTATMLSDGAIYSSIDFTTKTSYNSSSQITQATPYATTQILHSNSIHELAVDLPDTQWKSSIQQKNDLMGFGYSLPDQGKGNNGNYSSYFPEPLALYCTIYARIRNIFFVCEMPFIFSVTNAYVSCMCAEPHTITKYIVPCF